MSQQLANVIRLIAHLEELKALGGTLTTNQEVGLALLLEHKRRYEEAQRHAEEMAKHWAAVLEFEHLMLQCPEGH